MNIVTRIIRSVKTLPKNQFSVKLAVKNYSPNEVKVKVNNGYLVIEGRHEENGPQGKTTREFTKWFRIPEDVDCNTLVHKMTPDGTLSLTANKKAGSNKVGLDPGILSKKLKQSRPLSYGHVQSDSGARGNQVISGVKDTEAGGEETPKPLIKRPAVLNATRKFASLPKKFSRGGGPGLNTAQGVLHERQKSTERRSGDEQNNNVKLDPSVRWGKVVRPRKAIRARPMREKSKHSSDIRAYRKPNQFSGPNQNLRSGKTKAKLTLPNQADKVAVGFKRKGQTGNTINGFGGKTSEDDYEKQLHSAYDLKPSVNSPRDQKNLEFESVSKSDNKTSHLEDKTLNDTKLSKSEPKVDQGTTETFPRGNKGTPDTNTGKIGLTTHKNNGVNEVKSDVNTPEPLLGLKANDSAQSENLNILGETLKADSNKTGELDKNHKRTEISITPGELGNLLPTTETKSKNDGPFDNRETEKKGKVVIGNRILDKQDSSKQTSKVVIRSTPSEKKTDKQGTKDTINNLNEGSAPSKLSDATKLPQSAAPVKAGNEQSALLPMASDAITSIGERVKSNIPSVSFPGSANKPVKGEVTVLDGKDIEKEVREIKKKGDSVKNP